MKYSHSTSERPALRAPCPANPAQNAAVYLRISAAIERMLLWMISSTLARHSQGSAERFQRSTKFRLMRFSLLIALSLMPGTRAQKSALLARKIRAAKVRMRALYIRALKVRNQVRWMWGGGFRRAALGRFSNAFDTAKDAASFEALIPD